MISGVFRSTIAAAVTPDELRGRVSGIEFAVYAGGPVLGDVEAGLVGGVAGAPFAIVSGGLACVAAAAVFAARVRSFAGYVARPRAPAPPDLPDLPDVVDVPDVPHLPGAAGRTAATGHAASTEATPARTPGPPVGDASGPAPAAG